MIVNKDNISNNIDVGHRTSFHIDQINMYSMYMINVHIYTHAHV